MAPQWIIMDLHNDQDLAEITAADRAHALEEMARIADMYDEHPEWFDVRPATADDY